MLLFHVFGRSCAGSALIVRCLRIAPVIGGDAIVLPFDSGFNDIFRASNAAVRRFRSPHPHTHPQRPLQLDRCHALDTGGEAVRLYTSRWQRQAKTGTD